MLNATAIFAGQMVEGGGAFAPSPRLVKAAHEFEAMMMKELVHPMVNSGGLFGEEDNDTAAGSGNALSEYSAEALANSLSQYGGFGMADRIVADLSRESNYSGNGTVTKKDHRNTAIRTSK